MRQDLVLLMELCEKGACTNVIFVTTMWDVEPDGTEKDKELQKTYWRKMIKRGAITTRYDCTETTAWNIIELLCARHRIR
jgi:hypothetical protein